MSTRTRTADFVSSLEGFVGMKARFLVRAIASDVCHEAECTVQAVRPPTKPQFDIEAAIDRSTFTVLLHGALINGSNIFVVSGSELTSLNNGVR
jgi:hypothetical protein